MPTKRIKNYELRIKSYGLKRKTFTFLLVVFTFTFLLLPFNLSEVHAQPEYSYTGCDLCGWCGLKHEDKPKDWENCMRCLFRTRSIGLNPILTPGATYDGYKPWPLEGPQANYYPFIPEVPKSWTVFGCLDAGPGGFVSQIYKIIIAIGSGFAFLAILYGGFQVLTAGGDPQKVTSGKNTIMGALFGILLIVFSVFLLKLVGFDIIKIPGFS